MKFILSLLISLAVFFILPFQALALAPPTQISPINGATITSPKLEWQASSGPLYSTNPYKVQLANNPDFTSPKTPYYTSNTYYSPTTLSNATWYWKVNVRDSDGNWSGWSSVWNFTLTSPTSTPTGTPTPTPPPTSAPTPSSTSQPNSSFAISNTPSQINSDQSISVSVNLSLSNNPGTIFYLKGAFRHPDKPSNYFGLTKVGSSWIKNGGSFLNQYQITTDSSGNWSGNLEVKPDGEDSGFIGTGDYIFKVGKYDSSDTSPSVSWSNESIIKIVSVETESDQGVTSTNTSVPSTNPSTSPSSVKTKTTASTKSKSYDRLVYHTASVAAASVSASSSATPSAETEIKNQKQINPIIWVGLVFVFAGAATLGYIYLNKNAKIHLPLRK